MLMVNQKLKPSYVSSNIPFLQNVDRLDSGMYATVYQERFKPNFPSWTEKVKESPSARLMSTDRQFLVYWKGNQHTNDSTTSYQQDKKSDSTPKLNKLVDAKCVVEHRDPFFEKETTTTQKLSYPRLPIEPRKPINYPVSSIPFDCADFMETEKSTYSKAFTPRENAEKSQPFTILKNFPTPIYKDDHFLELPPTETKSQYVNPKIHSTTQEKSGTTPAEYAKSSNILGQTEVVAEPISTYNNYYIKKPMPAKESIPVKEKLILGDQRVADIQWGKSVVHEDYSYVRGERAKPAKQYPFKIGHPNCGEVNYKSTVTSDSYPKHGWIERVEINPLWTHQSSNVVIGRPDQFEIEKSYSHDLFPRWKKGDRCSRKCYPNWQLVDPEKTMECKTEFRRAYKKFQPFKMEPAFKDVSHITSEDTKGIGEYGTTYKDHYIGHTVSTPFNCTLLKQQDRSVKIPYFGRRNKISTAAC